MQKLSRVGKDYCYVMGDNQAAILLPLELVGTGGSRAASDAGYDVADAMQVKMRMTGENGSYC